MSAFGLFGEMGLLIIEQICASIVYVQLLINSELHSIWGKRPMTKLSEYEHVKLDKLIWANLEEIGYGG
jgi:hypothetical protein